MSAKFSINLSAFAGSSAAIKRPKEITCFSYDDDHQYRCDDSSLRYYYTPTLDVSLSQGFETFRKLDDTADDHLDGLLRSIRELEEKTGRKVEADLITWRGMMTKIMAAPYSDRDGFEMNATVFQGTIFLEENHDYKLQSWAKQRQQVSAPGRPSQDMMSYWGYKFEQLCLIPDTLDAVSRDFIEARETAPVSNHAQYCSVVRTGIGKTSLVLGGEVDAVWDIKPTPSPDHDVMKGIGPINWVELKTSQEIKNDRDAQYFERKLLKFWIQSFLLGVPKIVVGWRDRQGYLKGVEEIRTEGIPGTVKRRGRGAAWDGNVCINFASGFLGWLRETIGGEEGGVWRIRRREGGREIEVFRIEQDGYGGILSEEFVRWREKLAGKGKENGEEKGEEEEKGNEEK